jgi:hypothetical protein
MSARAELFQIIDRHVKRPAVAQIGGFRPEPGLKSWFGGNFHLPKDQPWPTVSGEPMIPLIQVVTSELPIEVPELSGAEVLQVFLGYELPIGTPVFDDPAFLVLTFSGEPLEPRCAPFDYSVPRPFQIKWNLGAPEGPSWEDAFQFVNRDLIGEFVKDDDCFDAYYDRYSLTHSTKMGGWPSYIQGAPQPIEGFVFQVASEEKPRWMVGDNGTLYFFRKGASWGLHWDCY